MNKIKSGYCCLCKQEIFDEKIAFVKVHSINYDEEKMCHLKCWKTISEKIDGGLFRYKNKFIRGNKFKRGK